MKWTPRGFLALVVQYSVFVLVGLLPGGGAFQRASTVEVWRGTGSGWGPRTPKSIYSWFSATRVGRKRPVGAGLAVSPSSDSLWASLVAVIGDGVKVFQVSGAVYL